MAVPDDALAMQQEADANLAFERHRDVRLSRLEPHRVAIAKMREQGWPYRKVVTWLSEERQIQVHHETLRRFCVLRKILKHRGETTGRSQRDGQPTPRSRSRSSRGANKSPTAKAGPPDHGEETDEFDLEVT